MQTQQQDQMTSRLELIRNLALVELMNRGIPQGRVLSLTFTAGYRVSKTLRPSNTPLHKLCKAHLQPLPYHVCEPYKIQHSASSRAEFWCCKPCT
jgi:hypothetical protein